MQEVKQLYKKLGEGEILQLYKGLVNTPDVDKLLIEAEDIINKLIPERKSQKRIYSTYVECIQNLYHHVCKNMDEGHQKGVILTTYDKESFSIITSNYINNLEVVELCEKIETINSLSQDKLKQLYLNRLTTTNFTPKGGGGLGLIDMARKSQNKLEYQIERYDTEKSIINLKVKILNL